MTTDISIVRWDPSQNNGQEYIDEYEYDGGNSSSRLFERSRIKALAGEFPTEDIFKVKFYRFPFPQRNVRQYKRKPLRSG